MAEAKSARPWRKPESYKAEKHMRDLVRPFLDSRGYTQVDEIKRALGGGESQIVNALNPQGNPVRLRVRSCWRWGEGGRKPGMISASQLTARYVDSFEATLDNVIRRNNEAQVTDLLLVQSARYRDCLCGLNPGLSAAEALGETARREQRRDQCWSDGTHKEESRRERR